MKDVLGYDVAVVYVRKTPFNRTYIDIKATNGRMTDFLFNDGVFTRQGQALSKFFESLHKECESEQCDGEEHGEDVEQIEGLEEEVCDQNTDTEDGNAFDFLKET
ncbi:uncharacterized protein LOC130648499 [Hydractinia symbiolongicarpus]|uniref:uncharacterized protein LOC130648499 n=1 Tax=Hydractinia symbiolongicarpus TaxID=13093 RepID=UPI00254AC457|nr:uncharacterized protein LOC130648499 [Hydractinia symbiolongicarpus]